MDNFEKLNEIIRVLEKEHKRKSGRGSKVSFYDSENLLKLSVNKIEEKKIEIQKNKKINWKERVEKDLEIRDNLLKAKDNSLCFSNNFTLLIDDLNEYINDYKKNNDLLNIIINIKEKINLEILNRSFEKDLYNFEKKYKEKIIKNINSMLNNISNLDEVFKEIDINYDKNKKACFSDILIDLLKIMNQLNYSVSSKLPGDFINPDYKSTINYKIYTKNSNEFSIYDSICKEFVEIICLEQINFNDFDPIETGLEAEKLLSQQLCYIEKICYMDYAIKLLQQLDVSTIFSKTSFELDKIIGIENDKLENIINKFDSLNLFNKTQKLKESYKNTKKYLNDKEKAMLEYVRLLSLEKTNDIKEKLSEIEDKYEFTENDFKRTKMLSKHENLVVLNKSKKTDEVFVEKRKDLDAIKFFENIDLPELEIKNTDNDLIKSEEFVDSNDKEEAKDSFNDFIDENISDIDKVLINRLNIINMYLDTNKSENKITDKNTKLTIDNLRKLFETIEDEKELAVITTAIRLKLNSKDKVYKLLTNSLIGKEMKSIYEEELNHNKVVIDQINSEKKKKNDNNLVYKK